MSQRSTTWTRIYVIGISVIFLVMGYKLYSLGDQAQQIGLAFLGLALYGLIVAAVYVSDWFRDLDESMNIMLFTLGAAFSGALVGLILNGVLGATLGMVIAVLVAQAIAVPISVYLYLRDEREYREYEEERRKYGKEP